MTSVSISPGYPAPLPLEPRRAPEATSPGDPPRSRPGSICGVSTTAHRRTPQLPPRNIRAGIPHGNSTSTGGTAPTWRFSSSVHSVTVTVDPRGEAARPGSHELIHRGPQGSPWFRRPRREAPARPPAAPLPSMSSTGCRAPAPGPGAARVSTTSAPAACPSAGPPGCPPTGREARCTVSRSRPGTTAARSPPSTTAVSWWAASRARWAPPPSATGSVPQRYAFSPAAPMPPMSTTVGPSRAATTVRTPPISGPAPPSPGPSPSNPGTRVRVRGINSRGTVIGYS